MKKNLLLLAGGGSSEHEISLKSAEYLKQQIDSEAFNIYYVVIDSNFMWNEEKYGDCQLNQNQHLSFASEENSPIKIDCVLPCIHGYPGETGDIQSYLELINIPYLGTNSEASKICFNKVSTKLWLENYSIATTPFTFIDEVSSENLNIAQEFFKVHKEVFIKASNQGSSVGCYHCNNADELESLLEKAFQFSHYVLIEKKIIGRELEVAVYQDLNGKIRASWPGEILTNGNFYDYEEKYSTTSTTKVDVKAKLSNELVSQIQSTAIRAFKKLNLSDIARIDFFLTQEGLLYINEINTFPGHTDISLFPKMVEGSGDKYSTILNQILRSLCK